MNKEVTLFVVLWIVISILICMIYDKIFPNRKLNNKTKGYLYEKRCYCSFDNECNNTYIEDCCKVTYEFNINGKKYRKTFRMVGTNPDLEVDILYNKGYSDAWPATIGRTNRTNGIFIKFLLCAFLAPALSRILVNLLNF